jgi:hypothetical protein
VDELDPCSPSLVGTWPTVGAAGGVYARQNPIDSSARPLHPPHQPPEPRPTPAACQPANAQRDAETNKAARGLEYTDARRHQACRCQPSYNVAQNAQKHYGEWKEEPSASLSSCLLLINLYVRVFYFYNTIAKSKVVLLVIIACLHHH